MRIAMVTDYSESGDRVDGGVQAVTKYLVEALAELPGLDLHVISFRYGQTETVSTEARGFNRHELPGAAGGAITGYRKDQQSLARLLARIRPDVVHGQGAGHDGLLAARSGYPVVITIHGIMAEEAKFYEGFIKRLRHRLVNLLSEHYCIRKARHTILISPYVADYFRDKLGGNKYLVPNPISEAFFQVPRHDQGDQIIFAGRLVPLKGVMDLVRAASAVSSSRTFRLILAGSQRDESYVERLRAECRRLGIEDGVEFPGILSEEELRQELGRSALLALPSYQESAPMVIIEAMAVGVPVVATTVGGIPQQVEDGVTGFLVAPGDVGALAEKLERLLGDDDLRRSMGEAARQRATDGYRASNVARHTVQVYEKVLAGAGE